MLQQFNPKNSNIQVWVGDKLFAREDAKISVFDSAVQGGDAVWEGLRLYPEGIFMLDRHLNRLYESAKAMAFAKIPSEDYMKNALSKTLAANKMSSDVHIRLTLTRGKKITSGMDPRLNQFGCTLIVLAEHKAPVYDNDNGIRIITSSIRRNNPAYVDSKIHHNNLINNIMAKIQANVAGVDDALMLDSNGFAAELNGTNLFMVKDQVLFTPFADACLPGITRGLIMELAQKNGISILEKNLSLTELYNADQLFSSGTMGELTPIVELDGRIIENRSKTSLFATLNSLFKASISKLCIPV